MELRIYALLFVIAVCFMTIAVCMFAGPLFLAYQLTTVIGLLRTMLIAGVILLVCWFLVAWLES